MPGKGGYLLRDALRERVREKDKTSCWKYVTYEEVPGYTHEWDFWDLSLRKAFDEWLPIKHDIILPEADE